MTQFPVRIKDEITVHQEVTPLWLNVRTVVRYLQEIQDIGVVMNLHSLKFCKGLVDIILLSSKIIYQRTSDIIRKE